MAGHETSELLPVHHYTGRRFGRIGMRIGKARHFGQFESLSRVHDADRMTTIGAVDADFDNAVQSLPVHELFSRFFITPFPIPENWFF
jgi:hypothetical protein